MWRSFRTRLAAVAALGLAVRWYAVFAFYKNLSPPPPDLTDNTWYWLQSKLLARGDGYANPIYWYKDHVIKHSAGHPPGYTTYLALFHLLGMHSPLAMRLASGLLGAACVVGVGLLARKLAGDRAGLLAAVFAALYPNLWINDGLILSESLAAPLIVLLLWQTYRFIERRDLREAVGLGVVIGVCCLTRSESQTLVVFLVAPLVLWTMRGEGWLRRLRLGGACVAVALVVVAPWVGTNLATFKHPVFLAIGAGFVLDVANCDSTYHGQLLGYTDANCSNETWPKNADESEIELVLRRHATAYIDAHTARLLTVVVPARVGRIWNVYRPLQGVDLDIFFERRGRWPARLALASYYVLGVLAAGGAVRLWKRKVPLLPMAAIVVMVTFTAASTMGITRYRIAAEVVWVVLAGVGAAALWDRIRPGDRGQQPPVSPTMGDASDATAGSTAGTVIGRGDTTVGEVR